tara:strand:+ start:4043 stop:5497 length:1455 start_codon:yes stop_codon:yes gene_type:complete
MADSRLTDLPNLTTPHNDDVLYIVDVSQDSSNKITYANLVANTIGSLSAYIMDIDIPAVNGLITDVGTLQVIQLTKADQTALDATNTNLNNLQSNVTVYANQTTKNANNIVALSGNIDNRATIINLNTTNANVLTLSSTVLTKASQASVDLKANQVDLVNLTSAVTNVSGELVSNISQTTRNTVNVVALSGYIDNKASQTAVTTNTVDIVALSGYIDGKATIASVALKANQTDFANLTGDVVTISDDLSDNIDQTTTNTVDIVALSGYIDDKADVASVDLNTSNIEELSATVLTKASQASVDLKANQIDLTNLTTNVNNVSSNVSSNNIQLADITTIQSQHDQDIIVLSGNSVTLSEFNSLSGTVTSQIAELSAEIIDGDLGVDMQVKRPFNISLTSQTNLLTTFYGITALSGNPDLTSSDISIIQVTAGLDGQYGKNWGGLLTNVYPISTEAIQVSVFNPTPDTISFTNTEIVLYMERGQFET